MVRHLEFSRGDCHFLDELSKKEEAKICEEEVDLERESMDFSYKFP